MKRLSVVVSLVIICYIIAATSHGEEYWAKTYIGYGGTQYYDNDIFYSVQQTSDGGYIVAGETNSSGAGAGAGDVDGWLLKLDSSGIVQWQKTYGGTEYEYARSVQQTSDNGYIVAGRIHSDIWLLKLGRFGVVQWQKTYGGSGIYNVSATSVQQTSDNGYIVVGGRCLLKLDSSGVVQWQKNFGGGAFLRFHSVQQTSDNGYILSLYNSSLLKLDSSGVVQWQKTYRYGDDFISSVQQTSDNGYILAGTIIFYPYEWFGLSYGGESHGWLLKLDSSGVVQWQKKFDGGTGFHSVQQTSDNGYILGGYTYSFETDSRDSWLVKLGRSGVVQWQKTYRYGDDFIYSVQQTSDNGYILAGRTDSSGARDVDGWLLKLDSSGNIPGCNIIGTNDALVTKTTVIGESSNITPVDSSAITNDTSISPQDTSYTVDTVCFEDTGPCPASVIYGNSSKETELLRSIRDNVLSKTHEGRELIKLYYQWSPVIVRAMEQDEDFKEDMKALVDGVLGMIEVE